MFRVEETLCRSLEIFLYTVLPFLILCSVNFSLLGLSTFLVPPLSSKKKKKKNCQSPLVCPFPGAHLTHFPSLRIHCLCCLMFLVFYNCCFIILSKNLVVSGKRINIVPVTSFYLQVKVQTILEGHTIQITTNTAPIAMRSQSKIIKHTRK